MAPKHGRMLTNLERLLPIILLYPSVRRPSPRKRKRTAAAINSRSECESRYEARRPRRSRRKRSRRSRRICRAGARKRDDRRRRRGRGRRKVWPAGSGLSRRVLFVDGPAGIGRVLLVDCSWSVGHLKSGESVAR